jgi:hypothetical protein
VGFDGRHLCFCAVSEGILGGGQSSHCERRVDHWLGMSQSAAVDANAQFALSEVVTLFVERTEEGTHQRSREIGCQFKTEN